MTTSNGHPKQKSVPPIVGHEDVLCRCGHQGAFPLFAPKADKFRDARREKFRFRNCPTCRIEAEKQRIVEHKKSKQQIPVPGAGPNASHKIKSRLPDGAEFFAKYDAATYTWSGTLTMDGITYCDVCSGIKDLLRNLDTQYRNALKATQEASQCTNA